MNYNRKTDSGKVSKRKLRTFRRLLILSLLIQTGFTMNTNMTDAATDNGLDLFSEYENTESAWMQEVIRQHTIKTLMESEKPIVEEVIVEEVVEVETGFKAYDIPLDVDIQKHIYDECQANNVPFELALAVAHVETGGTYNFKLRSKTSDSGLFQINDVHKKWLKESKITNLFDPYQNSMAGIWILKDALSKGDNIHTSLMVYNMGHGGARKLWKQGIYSSKYSRKVVETMELHFK